MDDARIEHICQQNESRRAELEAEYDPLRGIGSPLERTELTFRSRSVRLPNPMFEDHPELVEAQEAGSLYEYAQEQGYDWNAFSAAIQKLRFRYDFEFWAATAVRVKNKLGREVPLELWRPQRIYLKALEAQRLAGDPVRIVVLKHRQWGCTTLSYAYIAWHQIELYEGRNAWIVGLSLDGSNDVIERYKRIKRSYNRNGIKSITMRNWGGSTKTKHIIERDCYLAAGTVESPNEPSGRTTQYVHMTEIGKWPSNPTVSAEDIAQNMSSMLADRPGTVSIAESTAKASTGKYFRKLVSRARKGETNEEFLFVAWWQDPQYRKAVENPKGFIRSWEDYDEALWEMGASLEHIRWYREQQKEGIYQTEPWRLKEEFPSTPDEAFQTGDQRVFPVQYVQNLRKSVEEPETRGTLYADAETGAEALENLHFEEEPRGNLRVWRYPGDDYSGFLDEELRYGHRYCMAMDIGGTNDQADYTDIVVLDRAPMTIGGKPEVVAEWHGHLDQDLAAWVAARIGRWYENALLAIEVNSLPEDKQNVEIGPEPEHGQTVLHEIRNHYDNLYRRKTYDDARKEYTWKLGWHTGHQTKATAINRLRKAQREQGYLERFERACNEMEVYHRRHKRGRAVMAAADGHHDDCVITRAIMLVVHDQMPAVTEIEPDRPRKRKPTSAASF